MANNTGNKTNSTNNSNSTTITYMAQASFIRAMEVDYLRLIPNNQPDILTSDLGNDLLNYINYKIGLENYYRPKNNKVKYLSKLSPNQVGDLILCTQSVVAVTEESHNYPILAIYQYDGDNTGIYDASDRNIDRMIQTVVPYFETKEIEETKAYLLRNAQQVSICCEQHLIAVNNGIFNFDTKQLLPFDPKFVFLSKSKVNYRPNAQNVVIHNHEDNSDWDVESWMQELSDDPEVVNLLWEILGAIIRPNVHWNVSAWFYSESGNNGKGTLCELMRQLCGPGTFTSIPLCDFGKDFALERIIGASAIIVDENDVGTYIDKAAKLKAIITGDTLNITRKFKVNVDAAFHGFMVQCLNEMPRIKDKSDSFFRRQIFIPFTKCFTGVERKYIKNNYLHRQDVLEYVLYRVLNMNYYDLDVPQSCKDALEEYRKYNDPIRQFIDEVLPECKWTLLPYTFLYDLYVAWYKKTNPHGMPAGRNNFIHDLKVALAKNDAYQAGDNRIRPGAYMSVAEPLILKYDLVDWYNPKYKASGDVNLACHPVLSDSYRGIMKIDTSQP